MRKKETAGILAILLGVFGVHRFYLGQRGMGFMYLLLGFTGILSMIPAILGIVDGIRLLTMDQEIFDMKYNREITSYRERAGGGYRRDQQPQRRTGERVYRTQPKQAPVFNKKNPYKTSGIAKYKEYDYDGSIEDFKKALSINNRDIAVHFNLACAYSLTEQVDQSFFHLSKAVENGFDDFPKIKSHDALAYLRIQPQFETFAKNNYRLIGDKAQTGGENQSLLNQLKSLGELKEKGLLTEEEFQIEKRKLMG